MNRTALCPKCGKRVALRWDLTIIDHRRPTQHASRAQRGIWCNGSGKRYIPIQPNPNDQGCDPMVAS